MDVLAFWTGTRRSRLSSRPTSETERKGSRSIKFTRGGKEGEVVMEVFGEVHLGEVGEVSALFHPLSEARDMQRERQRDERRGLR